MSPPKSSPPKRRASALEEMNVLANLMGIQVAQAEEEMKPIKCVPPRASVLWGVGRKVWFCVHDRERSGVPWHGTRAVCASCESGRERSGMLWD
jgi:hypothetical protein